MGKTLGPRPPAKDDETPPAKDDETPPAKDDGAPSAKDDGALPAKDDGALCGGAFGHGGWQIVLANQIRKGTIMNETLPDTLFRAYDIRGIFQDTLEEDGARLIGRAIGSEVREQGGDTVVVGRDGRLSG